MAEKDLAALYCAARAFVYPSIWEGFGLPVLEAMACGTPVVAARVSSLPEVVGEAGMLIEDPLDAEALASALRRLATDDAERARLSAEGLRRAALFSLEAVTPRLVALYRQLLA